MGRVDSPAGTPASSRPSPRDRSTHCAKSLSGQADAGAVLVAYLRMSAPGSWHHGRAAGLKPALPAGRSFLERCLVELVPALLQQVPSGKRLPLLVKVVEPRRRACCGNRLARSLRHRQRRDAWKPGGTWRHFWCERWSLCCHRSCRLSWSGPFAVSVLDLRPLHDEFLPGEIALAAPAVLRIDGSAARGRAGRCPSAAEEAAASHSV